MDEMCSVLKLREIKTIKLDTYSLKWLYIEFDRCNANIL